jgi:hypothetical protein
VDPSIDLLSLLGSTLACSGSTLVVIAFNFLAARECGLTLVYITNVAVSSSYSSSMIPLGC